MTRSDVLIAASQPTATPSKPRRRFWSAENPWLWITPAIVFLMLYSIFPLIYNLVISFHDWKTRSKYWEFIGTENWTNLFADSRFWNSLMITFTYVIVAMAIQIVLGFIIALLLDAKPWGSGLMQALIILPMVTAPSVAGMLFRLLTHSEFGTITWLLRDVFQIMSAQEPLIGGTGRYALIGILLVDIWQWTPFFVLIILAGLKGIPEDVVEAAHVDGANWVQRLWRVKVPMLKTVLAVAVLFRLVDLYKVFDYVTIMTSGGPGGRTETLSYYGYVNTFQQIEWGYGAAIGITLMLLVWVSAFAFQKIFRIRW